MLRSTTEQSRLQLTAELRAVDGFPAKLGHNAPGSLFDTDLKRFPPVEDVVAALDSIVSRNFAA